ncbi:MAG TPA: MarR family transcriptional regulator [Gaiellaceae bacterium]
MEEVPLERFIRIAEFRANLRAFLRHNEHACRHWGLTPQRYLLLLAIKGAPDGSERMSFTEVAERLQLSRNTVTELCGRAEEAGLLLREPSTVDQRVVYLRVSKEGERRLAGVILESDGFRSELLTAFDSLSTSFRGAIRRPRS